MPALISARARRVRQRLSTLHDLEFIAKSRAAGRSRSRRTPAWIALLVVSLFGFTACHQSDTTSPTSAPPAAPEASATPTAPAEATTTSELRVADLIRDAEKRLQAGAFDEAAADLLRVQSTQQAITPEESASYREAMGAAMRSTMEAAAKGDARAQNALQMLRAARGR